MTKEEFVADAVEAAKEKAEADWEKRMNCEYKTSAESVSFSRWMDKEIKAYSKAADREMDRKFRLCSAHEPYGIYNAVRGFALHVIRRNCRMSTQLKSLCVEDIPKAKAIVEDVLELCNRKGR